MLSTMLRFPAAVLAAMCVFMKMHDADGPMFASLTAKKSRRQLHELLVIALIHSPDRAMVMQRYAMVLYSSHDS